MNRQRSEAVCEGRSVRVTRRLYSVQVTLVEQIFLRFRSLVVVLTAVVGVHYRLPLFGFVQSRKVDLTCISLSHFGGQTTLGILSSEPGWRIETLGDVARRSQTLSAFPLGRHTAKVPVIFFSCGFCRSMRGDRASFTTLVEVLCRGECRHREVWLQAESGVHGVVLLGIMTACR